jgi:hypothetical protein
MGARGRATTMESGLLEIQADFCGAIGKPANCPELAGSNPCSAAPPIWNSDTATQHGLHTVPSTHRSDDPTIDSRAAFSVSPICPTSRWIA